MRRYTIFAMLQRGYAQKDIATTIGVNKSTVSRELTRNCDMRSGKYIMDLAQRKSDKRKSDVRYSHECRRADQLLFKKQEPSNSYD